MIVRSKAPLRISFAGGGTDISPFSDQYGGLVLNATINKYAYTTIIENKSQSIDINSLDFNYRESYNLAEPLKLDGKLDLPKGVINRFKRDNQGINVITHNDAPPGSGLGSSSAMVISLLNAFKKLQSLQLDSYEMAELAHEIERNDLKIVGGKQDQYCAAFGGFNFMEFDGDRVLVNPLRISADFINELEFNLLLMYTGTSRESSKIIESQVKNVNSGNEKSINAMHELKEHAIDMKKMLLTGNARGFGEMLNVAWESKKAMSDNITNPHIDELYDEGIKAGAIGGKVSGAGGGGFMMFYCDNNKKHKVAKRLEELGGEIVDFRFEANGVQSWVTNNDSNVCRPQSEFKKQNKIIDINKKYRTRNKNYVAKKAS